MAAQQDFTVYTASAASNNGFYRVVEKEEAKQKKELAHLTTLLKVVEKDLAEAKSSGKTKGASKNEGPSSTAFENAMAELALALQMLQVKIAQFGNDKAKMDTEISKDQVKMAENALKEAHSQLEKLEEEVKRQKTESFWTKLIGGIVTAIVDVVALVTFNPEIAVMATAIYLLSATGALNKLSQGIASVLEDMGCSDKVAELIASGLVILVVLAASYFVPTSGVSAAAEAGEDAAAELEALNAAEPLAEEGEEVAMSTSTMQKVGSFLKKINLFRHLSPKTNLMIMNAFMAANETGFPKDLADITLTKNASDKKKEELEHIFEIVFEVLALIAMIAGGAAAAEGMGNSDRLALRGTRLGKMLTKLQRFAQSSKFYSLAQGGVVAGSIAQGAAQVAAGITLANQGVLEKQMAELKKDTILIGAVREMIQTQIRGDQNFLVTTEKHQRTGDRSLGKLMKGEAGFATLLTTSSAV